LTSAIMRKPQSATEPTADTTRNIQSRATGGKGETEVGAGAPPRSNLPARSSAPAPAQQPPVRSSRGRLSARSSRGRLPATSSAPAPTQQPPG
jgi:hypothetical protein